MPTFTSLPGVDPFPFSATAHQIYAFSPFAPGSIVQPRLGLRRKTLSALPQSIHHSSRLINSQFWRRCARSVRCSVAKSLPPLDDDDMGATGGPTARHALRSSDDIIKGSERGAPRPSQVIPEQPSHESPQLVKASVLCRTRPILGFDRKDPTWTLDLHRVHGEIGCPVSEQRPRHCFCPSLLGHYGP